MKRKETILVTGGAGFIGSHTCDKLLTEGKEVICIDNLNSYYSPERKKANIKHNLSNPNFKFFKLDITDKEKLEKLFNNEKIDKIIHLAAMAGVRYSIENPLLYNKTNILGTLNILEIAKNYKIKNLICASSSSVYGKNKKVPFSEKDRVDECISPYAATKKACETFCYTYHHLFNINITCFRFFTVYGPRGRPDMAPYLFTDLISKGKQIKRFGNGKTKRDYTYVKDIVEGIYSALNKNLKFEIINLGNSEIVELNYFISVIENLVGKKAKVKQYPEQPGDVPITYADITKAKKLLGYNPTTSIEEGMKKFVEWYKKENILKS